MQYLLDFKDKRIKAKRFERFVRSRLENLFPESQFMSYNPFGASASYTMPSDSFVLDVATCDFSTGRITNVQNAPIQGSSSMRDRLRSEASFYRTSINSPEVQAYHQASQRMAHVDYTQLSQRIYRTERTGEADE